MHAPSLKLQALWVCLIVVLCLAPFARKAFHIDDPLFVWTAQHIQHHPLDPYGYTVNWNGTAEQVSAVTKNPPLCSYYLALAGSIFGWSEFRLHVAMLVPAVLAVLGTFLLATKLCDRPMEAALAALLTPVFLVSATSVMCDVMMLAFWVWALLFWMRGLETNKQGYLAGAAVLLALCALTKYYGAVLIPLLLIYGLVKKKRPGLWAAYLLFPVVAIAAYYFGTSSLYDRDLLADAVSYATEAPHVFNQDITVALAFMGGCLAVVVFYALRLWPRRALLAWAGMAVASIAGLWMLGRVPGVSHGFSAQNAPIVRIEMGIMLTAGISVIVLAVLDLKRRLDAESVLLFLWVMGTFCFAGFVNWSVNGRSILPMVPAVAVLMMRQVAAREKSVPGNAAARTYLPLVLAGLLSLAVVCADFIAAGAARGAAIQTYRMYKSPGAELWFEGHWGFQYYIQRLGAKPIDGARSTIPKGATIIVPILNTQLLTLPIDSVNVRRPLEVRVMPWIATLSEPLGAGFYSSVFGALPYVIGPQPPEPYFVLTTKYVLEHPCDVPMGY